MNNSTRKRLNAPAVVIAALVCLPSATCFAVQYKCPEGLLIDVKFRWKDSMCVKENGEQVMKAIYIDDDKDTVTIHPSTPKYIKPKKPRSAEEKAILSDETLKALDQMVVHEEKITPLSKPLTSVDGKPVPKWMQEKCFGPYLGKENYIFCVQAERWYIETEKRTPISKPLPTVDGKPVPKHIQQECFIKDFGKEYYIECVRTNMGE